MITTIMKWISFIRYFFKCKMFCIVKSFVDIELLIFKYDWFLLRDLLNNIWLIFILMAYLCNIYRTSFIYFIYIYYLSRIVPWMCIIGVNIMCIKVLEYLKFLYFHYIDYLHLHWLLSLRWLFAFLLRHYYWNYSSFSKEHSIFHRIIKI